MPQHIGVSAEGVAPRLPQPCAIFATIAHHTLWSLDDLSNWLAMFLTPREVCV
jgi:hypothetical protein